MKRITHIILFSLFLLLLFTIGCGQHPSHEMTRMNTAETLMEEFPDSALIILDSIDVENLRSEKERARYALLTTIAIDKNWIDTTTFDVLQPAIDYYLISNKGTADEKLRTLYYQGRIFQNRREDEDAMKCYIQGIELKDEITDSLCLARLYYAQGMLYEKQCLYPPFINAFMEAYELYTSLTIQNNALDCLAGALNGCILSKDIQRADSIYSLANSLSTKQKYTNFHILHSEIIYSFEKGDDDVTKKLLDSISLCKVSNEIILDLADGYNKLREPSKGLIFLKQAEIKPTNIIKYLLIKSDILESLGDYKESVKNLRCAIDIRDSTVNEDFSLEIQSVENRYRLEKQAIYEKRSKEKVFLISICGCLIGVVVITSLTLLYRSIKIRNLKIQKHNLMLEVKSMQLLREKEKAEKEIEDQKKKHERIQNLLSAIEKERDDIVADLSNEKEIVKSLRKNLKDRLVIFNGHLASIITSNEKYSTQYQILERSIHGNKRKFLDEVYAALKTINPEFINNLERLEISTVERDVISLFALGLKGKEIGIYLKITRLYVISSEIRAKLGLKSSDTNLGVYIQSKFK